MSKQNKSWRLSAEFEPHKGTYLLWPVRPDNWRDGARHAQAAIAELANLLVEFEPVTIGFLPGTKPSEKCRFRVGVQFVEMAYDDIWVRDTGPLILVGDEPPSIAVDFRFNSWGGLLESASADDGVARTIATMEKCEIVKTNFVLEGGAVITDGAGTIIVTEESVLAENRNPGLAKREAEHILRETLNADQVIWLPFGLANDEAGGHIDNVCAFASPTTLLVANTNDKSHSSHDRLEAAYRILLNSCNSKGEAFTLIKMPLPPETSIRAAEAAGFALTQGTIKRSEGILLAPSHINFYVANGIVIAPVFGCSTDTEALGIISTAFPNHEVRPFQSREFLLGGGAVHCVTRDIPRTPNRREVEQT